MRWFAKSCILGASLILMLCLSSALAYDFGTKVAPGDVDIGQLLYNCDPSIGYWDIGIPPGVYDGGDIVYLDMDDNGRVDAYDVRLTPYGTLAAGTKVTPADNDINAPLMTLADPTISFMELDTNPGYDLADSVYLHILGAAAASTQPNDVRLTKVNGLDAGTRVMDFHGDNNMPVRSLLTFPVPVGGPVATIRFYNANGNYNIAGNPIYDYPDVVYLDVSLTGANSFGFVVVNNVRLSV